MRVLLAGLLLAVPAAAEPLPLPNAWRITDNSSAAGGSLNYTTNLPAGLRQAATNLSGGFRFSVNARFLSELGGTRSMGMGYGLGNRRFFIWFTLDNQGDLAVELEGTGAPIPVTTGGRGTNRYHTHEIVYDGATARATYLLDGNPLNTAWTGSANSLTAGQVHWGSGSSAGKGQMNFHSVVFEVTNQVVASYQAGTEGNPVTAPDPTTQGWISSHDSPPAGVSVTHISPDTALLPVAVTLPADEYQPDSARLRGRVNPAGSPTDAWFEWGTDTAYGHATPPQPVGDGAQAADFYTVLEGLTGGLTYHYRLVASNTFGVVAGTNQTFNLSFLLTSIPGLPGVGDGSVAWGDYDQDGRLDFLLTGFVPGIGGVSQLWRNNLPLSNTPPSAPGDLAATVSGTRVALNWTPPSDDVTPTSGLNYSVRIGTAPGESDVLAPMALPDGQRLLPAPGKIQTPGAIFDLSRLPPGRTCYWSVQALDTSFTGSPFADEAQFTLGPLVVNPFRYPAGPFEFHFTNQSALNFDVLVTTNAALPVSNWQNLGPALHLGGGLYRFTDPGAVGQTQRYYLLDAQ